jgi:hypothetical protein
MNQALEWPAFAIEIMVNQESLPTTWAFIWTNPGSFASPMTVLAPTEPPHLGHRTKKQRRS